MDLRILNNNPLYHCVILNFHGGGDMQNCRALIRHGQDVLHSHSSCYLSWADDLIKDLLIHENRPWAILNGDTSLLGSMVISDEDRARIQERGLAIYMYEPLFIRDWSGRFAREVFEPVEGRIGDESLSQCGSIELDSVINFKRYNNISSKVTVYTCDNGISELIKKFPQYQSLNCETLDIFMIHEAMWRREHKHDFRMENDIEAKFACLNYRHESFREIVVGFLRGKNLDGESLITYFHTHNEEVFNERCYTPMSGMKHWDTIHAGIQKVHCEVPYSFVDHTENAKAVDPELHPIPSTLAGHNKFTKVPSTYHYRNSFLAICNETRFFHRHGILTEKTTVPIFSARPFLLVSSPYTYRYIHELGFQSFSQYWDESFDAIEDPAQRMDQILTTVEKISQWDLKKMADMLEEMKPILKYNFDHLIGGFIEMQTARVARDSKL
jgi:hypothetical protein